MTYTTTHNQRVIMRREGIICTLCLYLGLSHDGDHLVPRSALPKDTPPLSANRRPGNVFDQDENTTEPLALRIYCEDHGDKYPWCIDAIDVAGRLTDDQERYSSLAEALFAAPSWLARYPSLAKNL